MRTTTETVVMPHTMLAALFAHSAPPRLELRARLVPQDAARPRLEMRLVNRGRAVARRPVVKLYDPIDLAWKGGPLFKAHSGDPEDGPDYTWIGSTEDLDLYPDADGLVLATAVLPDRGRHFSSMSARFQFRFHALLMSCNSPPVEGEAVLELRTDQQIDQMAAQRAIISGEQ
jgi:hypothetical protein